MARGIVREEFTETVGTAEKSDFFIFILMEINLKNLLKFL
jgi:hypothetical protein